MKTLRKYFINVTIFVFALCALLFSAIMISPKKLSASAVTATDPHTATGIDINVNDYVSFDVVKVDNTATKVNFCFIENWGAHSGYYLADLDALTVSDGGSVTKNGDVYTISVYLSIAGTKGGNKTAVASTVYNNIYCTSGNGGSTKINVSNFQIIEKEVYSYRFNNDSGFYYCAVKGEPTYGVSFEYALDNPAERMSAAFGTDAKYYGYFNLRGPKNGNFVAKDGAIYYTKLDNGRVKAVVVFSELQNYVAGTDMANVIVRGNWCTTGGYIYNLHNIDNYYSVSATNGTVSASHAESGESVHFKATASTSSQSFLYWTDADGNVVSRDLEFDYVVNSNVSFTANYTDNISFTAGAHTFDLVNKAVDGRKAVSYIYKLDDTTKTMSIGIGLNGSNYFGYYSLTNDLVGGPYWGGLYISNVEGGYKRVTMLVDEINGKRNGTPTSNIAKIYTNSALTSSGVLQGLHSFNDVVKLTVVGANGTTYVERGDSVMLTADKKAGKIFTGWQFNDGSVNYNKTINVTVEDNMSVTAMYADAKYNSYEVGDPIDLSIAGTPSNTITFDYKIYNSGSEGGWSSVAFLNNWTVIPLKNIANGYIALNNNTFSADNGVSAESIGDGYYRVTVVNDALLNATRLYATSNYNRARIDIGNVTFVEVAKKYNVTVNGGSGAGEYVEDTQATIVANAPQSGYYFNCWKDASGNIVSRDSSYTFTVSADVAYTAEFLEYTGTYYAKDTERRINARGDIVTNYEQVVFDYKLVNETGKITICLINGSKYYGYFDLFKSGSTSYNGISCEVQENGYVRVTMNVSALNRTNNNNNTDNKPDTFGILLIHGSWTTSDYYLDNLQFIKTVTVNIAGGTITSGAKDSYNTGDQVTITANAPQSGYYFNCWKDASGNIVSRDSSYTFTVIDNVAYTAEFLEYTGTYYAKGTERRINARGNIVTNYEQVVFDYKLVNETGKITICLINGSKYYGYFDLFKSGSTSYNGISCEVQANGYVRVTMNVSALNRTNNNNNTNNKPDTFGILLIHGSWTTSDYYLANLQFIKHTTVTVVDGTGSGEYLVGDSVTVTANAPASGKAFAGWSDGENIVSTESTYNFTVAEEITLIAVYGNLYTVSVVNGSGEGEYVEGVSVTVTANDVPNDKDYFIGWKVNGKIVSQNLSYTFNVSGNVTLTAEYGNDNIDNKVNNAGWAKLATTPYLYDKVIFEYRKGSANNVTVALINDKSAGWSQFFGYYNVASEDVLSGNTSGIKAVLLDDGYYRITMTLSELTIKNGGNEVEQISGVYTNVSGWFIRNVRFVIDDPNSTFAMVNGASIRLNEPYGIKFQANIPLKLYNEDATYGMIIIPFDWVEALDLHGEYIEFFAEHDIEVANMTCLPIENEYGDYYIQGSLVNLKPANIERKFIGIAYERLGNEEDGYTYTYALIPDGGARSIREVAQFIYIDSEFDTLTEEQQLYVLTMAGYASEAELTNDAFEVNCFDSNVTYLKTDGIDESKTLALSSAKNEQELGQLIITALKPSVEGNAYNIELGDLTLEDGTVLSKENITVYNGHYIHVTETYAAGQWDEWYPDGWDSTKRELSTRYGWYVDALVPFKSAQFNNENIFVRMQNGEHIGDNQTIYLNFAIPENQRAGTYTGYFKVSVDNNGYVLVPVEYTVYDFTLPSQNNAVNAFEIELEFLNSMYAGGANRIGYSSEEYKNLYDYLLDFNVNAGRLPDSLYYGDYDWNHYLANLIKYTNDDRVSAINLYVNYSNATYGKYEGLMVINQYDMPSDLPQYNIYGVQTILQKLVDYSKTNNINLLKKLYIRLPQNDEPNYDDNGSYIQAILSYNNVRRSIDHVLLANDWAGYEDIRDSLDNIAYMVTCEPNNRVFTEGKYVQKSGTAYWGDSKNRGDNIIITYTSLHDYVPMYCFFHQNSSTISRFSGSYNNINTILTDADSAHTHLWWYGCNQPQNPYPNYDVYSNSVISRSSRWVQFAYGIEGELYYAVNGWRQNVYDLASKKFIVIGPDAWLTEDEVWEGKSGTAGAVGDGVLVYPSSERYEEYNANNGDNADLIYCATVRLFNIRESIDDYNYLCYAQSLIDNLIGTEKENAQNRLNAILNTLYTAGDAATINGDANTLRIARKNLVQLIEYYA